MSVIACKEEKADRREFPRFKERGLVQYFSTVVGDWCEAELRDYSASGACFQSKGTLLPNTKITVHIMSNEVLDVPAVAVFATVVWCQMSDEHKYKIGCKFDEVIQEFTSV